MIEFRKILFLLSLVSLNMQVSIAQDSPVTSTDSLFKIRSSTSGKPRAEINLEIARYHFLKDQDSLLYYIGLVDQYLEKEPDTRMEGFVYKFKGYNALLSLDFDSAIMYDLKALNKFQELNDAKESGWVLNNMGNIYYRLDNFAVATDYFLRSLSFFEQIDNKHGIAEIYNNLGRISYRSGQPEKARNYFESSLELFKGIGRNKNTYKIYNNLGLILFDQELFKEALDYFTHAANGYQMLKDKTRLATVYGNMALCYDGMSDLPTAEIFTRKALKQSMLLDYEIGIIVNTINLGYLLRSQGQYDSARIYLNMALDMATEKNLLSYKAGSYEELAYLEVAMNDYKNAYLYRVRQDSIKHLIINQQSTEKINELMFSYEQKLKEREIDQLRAEQRMQSRLNTIFLIAIILSMALLVILVYWQFSIRRSKQLLTGKNNLLYEYNKRLVASESDLKTLMNEKNKLFSIIAHDLKNPVSAVNGFSELLMVNYDELHERTRKEYVLQIYKGSERTLSLLENLLLWAQSQMNNIKVEKESVPVIELINDCTSHLMTLIENKNLELVTEIPENFLIFVDKEMIKAVIRNLLSNAIKFSFPGQKIIISVQSSDNENCIKITDYGTGMKPEFVNELFTKLNIPSSSGTSEEKGSGLGLLIAKDYTEKNDGELKIDSAPGKGSTFSICFSKS